MGETTNDAIHSKDQNKISMKTHFAILCTLVTIVASIILTIGYFVLKAIDKVEEVVKESEPLELIDSIPSVDDTLEGAKE